MTVNRFEENMSLSYFATRFWRNV